MLCVSKKKKTPVKLKYLVRSIYTDNLAANNKNSNVTLTLLPSRLLRGLTALLATTPVTSTTKGK